MNEAARVIFIAGDSGGVGRRLADKLKDEGHVVVGMSRHREGFDDASFQHITGDATEESEISNALASIVAEHGSIDTMICALGHASGQPALLATKEQMELSWRTNALAPFLLMRETIKIMKRSGRGRILLMSSIAVPHYWPGVIAYASSKAALEQIASGFVGEIGSGDITVNALGLSFVDGPGMAEEMNKKVQEKARLRLPKAEMVDISEILHAIHFFSSDLTRNISGQVLYFGGVR
jgi:3-oxoacyl-[acyl-carrier protein] reductase